MKSLLIFLLLVITSIEGRSQQALWERTVGLSGNPGKLAFEYTILPDRSFMAVFKEGQITTVTRFDSLGLEIWSDTLPSGLRLRVQEHAMLKIVPGGILIGLQLQAPDTNRLALVKLSWQGAHLWTKTISTGRYENGVSDMHIRSANEYVLLAVGTNNNSQTIGQGGATKFMAIGVDSLGNKLWQQSYIDNPLSSICYPKEIIPYKPDGFIFTGHTSTTGTIQPRFIKTDATGNLIQSEIIPDSLAQVSYNPSLGDFIYLSDGNILYSGYNGGTGVPVQERYILVSKIDTALNVQWMIAHNEPGNMFGSSKLLEMADGNYLVVTQQHQGDEIILLKISPQGQPIDTTYVPVTHTTCSSCLVNIFLLPDGSLIYGSSFFLAKIGNVGLPATFTGTPEAVTGLGTLGMAYPNPAAGIVTIPYVVSGKGHKASLRIAEVATGRLVSKIILNLEGKEAKIDLTNFRTGVYTYTLLIDEVPSGTKKLVVIK